jgi:hypothetical protein
MFTLAVDVSPDKSDLDHAITAQACVAYPKFVIQSTWPCHFKVVPVAPTANGRSVDGVDYADFGAAKTVRDRLNAEAAL